MSHDLQMARGAADGGYNLAIGEPYFMQELLLKHVRVTSDHSKPLRYPAIGGEPELIESLHRLHPEYSHIVVTTGAKQGIEACLYALAESEGRRSVFHAAPYWPSYPTLAQKQGLEFNPRHPNLAEEIFVVTSPNNPDGKQRVLFKRHPDIWDAVYASPIYGYWGEAPPHRMAIFSAAKYLGLSGIRVGWVGTNEPELAAKISYFVEISTSGVAVNSQMWLHGCLQALREPSQIARLTEAHLEARAALILNGNTFNELLSAIVEDVSGVPSRGEGMFAWFKAKDPDQFVRAMSISKVRLVTGEACGEKRPGYYRMSMGQMPEYTREALTALRNAYEAL